MQNEPFPEMTHMVNVKIESVSDNSFNSDDAKNKLCELNIKKSEYSPEGEENLKESRVEMYASSAKSNDEPKYQTLNRTTREDPLLHQRNSHQCTKSSNNTPAVEKQTPEFGKDHLTEEIEEDQENDEPKTEKNTSTTEYEELQSFFIDILKHKLKNSEYFRIIKDNHTFLQKQIG
jgi:hypothetical protein